MKRNCDMHPRCYADRAPVKRTHVTTEERAEIWMHWGAGANVEQTSRAFKRSPATINKILSQPRIKVAQS